MQQNPRPLIGGMVALDYHVQEQRAKHANTLLLDAGDMMTGTPISKISVQGAMGGGFIAMMNEIGYQIGTIGNHEFDEGFENLRNLLQLAKFDIVSANLFYHDQPVANKAYQIRQVGKVRIGIIGVILTGLADVTAKKNLAGIVVADPIEIVQKIIAEIDPKTDLIVLLTHQGVEDDLALADGLQGVDVIVGGHSHSRLQKVVERNGVLIVQADSKTRYLGRLSLRVKEDRVTGFDYELIPTWVDQVKKPNPKMIDLVERYKKMIDAEYNVAIGTLQTDWQNSRRGETNIGNYIADVMRKAAGTDIAFINSGGIRKSMPAGPVKKMDIVEILPFSNYLLTFECTGEQLIALVKNNILAEIRGEEGILQISGFNYSYKVNDDSTFEVRHIQVGDRSVDPAAIYSGVSVDFILEGRAANYLGSEPAKVYNLGILIADALVDHIEKNPMIHSSKEGRIKQIR